jgi:hypothetical protein
MWGLPLTKPTYTFTQDWAPWPTAAEKDGIFITKVKSRYGGESTEIEISHPEEVKTRRQLRDRAFIEKAKADLEAEKAKQ